MIKFDKISALEKLNPFVSAKAAAEYINGAFGTVATGTFTIGATGFYAIMDMEKGDDANTTDYRVKKDAQCRVADLEKAAGYVICITSEHLPATAVAVGNKMVSKADGTLEVPGTAPSAEYLEVTELTSYGVKAKIVK